MTLPTPAAYSIYTLLYTGEDECDDSDESHVTLRMPHCMYHDFLEFLETMFDMVEGFECVDIYHNPDDTPGPDNKQY